MAVEDETKGFVFPKHAVSTDQRPKEIKTRGGNPPQPAAEETNSNQSEDSGFSSPNSEKHSTSKQPAPSGQQGSYTDSGEIADSGTQDAKNAGNGDLAVDKASEAALAGKSIEIEAEERTSSDTTVTHNRPLVLPQISVTLHDD